MGKSQESRVKNINSKAVEKAAPEVDKAGSARFNWKRFFILVGGALSGTAAVVYGGTAVFDNLVVPEVPYAVVDTIYQNEKNTFVDEVLEQQANSVNAEEGELSLLQEVQQLELYLSMVNDLNDLNLHSYTTTEIEATSTENFDKNLKDAYARFLEILNTEGFDPNVLSPESLELHELAAKLNGYKTAVEKKITLDGYRIVADFGILVVKTEVVDASKLSYMKVGNLTIPGYMKPHDYYVEYKDPTTGKEYRIGVPANSIIHQLISDIYYAQGKIPKEGDIIDGETVTTEATAEGETVSTTSSDEESIDKRVEDLNAILNKIKVAIYVTHINDGKLKPTVGYNYIRDILANPEKTTEGVTEDFTGPTK